MILKCNNLITCVLFLLGNCDFEVDTCSWSNSRNDTFDWQRASGGTTSTGTGPSSDHTLANSTGKRMHKLPVSPVKYLNRYLEKETKVVFVFGVFFSKWYLKN